MEETIIIILIGSVISAILGITLYRKMEKLERLSEDNKRL